MHYTMTERVTKGKNVKTPTPSERPFEYRVIRIVREVYIVESDHRLEKSEEVWGQLMHPASTEIQDEIIQQVRP